MNLTPNQVAQQLIDLGKALDVAVTELGRLDRASVEAKAKLEVAYAEAFIGATGAENLRKQKAILAASDQQYTLDIALMLVRHQRELIRAISTRIDIGRTVSTTLRSEIALAGTGGP